MKYTPWFSKNVKPIHIGVYMVKNIYGEIGYSYFNGEKWAWREPCIEDAYMFKHHTYNASQDKKWRGLAQKP